MRGVVRKESENPELSERECEWATAESEEGTHVLARRYTCCCVWVCVWVCVCAKIGVLLSLMLLQCQPTCKLVVTCGCCNSCLKEMRTSWNSQEELRRRLGDCRLEVRRFAHTETHAHTFIHIRKTMSARGCKDALCDAGSSPLQHCCVQCCSSRPSNQLLLLLSPSQQPHTSSK